MARPGAALICGRMWTGFTTLSANRGEPSGYCARKSSNGLYPHDRIIICNLHLRLPSPARERAARRSGIMRLRSGRWPGLIPEKYGRFRDPSTSHENRNGVISSGYCGKFGRGGMSAGWSGERHSKQRRLWCYPLADLFFSVAITEVVIR